jgi:predicted nuclease of predicted toxin-antitoxin system
VKFFFDNNLAPRIAKALNILVSPEHQVIHLKDLFPADTDDVVWMEKLAKEKDLIIITGDLRIGKNPQEMKLGGRLDIRSSS